MALLEPAVVALRAIVLLLAVAFTIDLAPIVLRVARSGKWLTGSLAASAPISRFFFSSGIAVLGASSLLIDYDGFIPPIVRVLIAGVAYSLVFLAFFYILMCSGKNLSRDHEMGDARVRRLALLLLALIVLMLGAAFVFHAHRGH